MTNTTTTVRMPVALLDRLRILAAAHDRSLSAELRVALAGYLRDHEAQQ